MGHLDGGTAARIASALAMSGCKAAADLVRGWLFAELVQESQEKPRLNIAPEQEAAAASA